MTENKIYFLSGYDIATYKDLISLTEAKAVYNYEQKNQENQEKIQENKKDLDNITVLNIEL
jgi:hypothetical protein